MSRLKSYCRLLRDILLMPIALVFPRNRKKIVFGAWFGRQFAGNSKYLLKYILDRGGYTCIWVGDELIRGIVETNEPRVRFVRKDSWLAWWHLFTAKIIVNNINLEEDFGRFPHYQRALILNTDHGVVNKRCGVTALQGNGRQRTTFHSSSRLRTLAHNTWVTFADFVYGEHAWGSTSSVAQRDLIAINTYPGRYLRTDRKGPCRLMTKGQPCEDFLIHNKSNEVLKQTIKAKYAKLFGVSPDKRWYLYVPTWRHADGVPFTFVKSHRLEDYNRVLEAQNAVLIDKEHPKTLEKVSMAGGLYGSIYVVSPEMSIQVDIQELMLVCDRLISDYSTIYYDYGVLKRPIIEWTFDYDFMATQDFGLEFDLREYAPGPFAYTEDELLKLLGQTDEELLASRTAKFESHIDCEKGEACEAYYQLIKERT